MRDFVLTYAWNALWQVPLMGAGGWLADRMVRRLGPAVRHRLAVLNLLLATIVPGLPAPSLPAQWMRAWGFCGEHGLPAVSIPSLVDLKVHPQALFPLPRAVLTLLLVTYLTLLGVSLMRFGRGLWQLRALARGSRPLQLETFQMIKFQHLERVFRLHDVHMRTSEEIGGPTTFWMGASLLLLPSRLIGVASGEDLMAALAHECAHLQRRDFALQLTYALCTLPISMHPLTGPLRDRVSETREMVCDAQAARALLGGEKYASALLRLAALLPTLHPSPNLHAIAMLDAHSFERRIITMLNPQEPRSRLGRFGSVLAAGLVGIMTCTSALALHAKVESGAGNAGQMRASLPEIVYRKAPVYPAEARADNTTLNGTVTLAVEVNPDGKPTSVRVAKGLRADYDQSAVDAVTEWRFLPATDNGKPVAASLNININYMLEP